MKGDGHLWKVAVFAFVLDIGSPQWPLFATFSWRQQAKCSAYSLKSVYSMSAPASRRPNLLYLQLESELTTVTQLTVIK